jgi:adenylate cyclase class 2
MKRHRSREVEVKLRVADLGRMRGLLRSLGARLRCRVWEHNTLYDTSRSRLRKRGHLLRLRILTPLQGRGTGLFGLLTYKGPSLRLQDWNGSRPQRPRAGQRYKVREEIEASTANPERLAGILEALGLAPSFRYEKIRASYVLPRLSGLNVELDETPVGNFLELEGTPRLIDRAARLLGYKPADYITRSYLALHLEDRRRRGLPNADMVFGPRRRPRQRKK